MIAFKPQLKALLKQISFLFLLYEVCRVLFYIFNHSSFQDISVGKFLLLLIYGLRFDAFSIAALSSVYVLLSSLPFKFYFTKPYQIALAIFFILPNSIGLLLNFIDFAYFPFNNKRSTFNVINFIFNGQTEFLKLLPQFLKQYWLVVIIFIGLEIVFIKFYLLMRATKVEQSISRNFKTISVSVLYFLLVNAVCVLGIRGGLQRIPIMIIDAAAYTSPANIPIVINTPFFVIKSAELASLEPIQLLSEKEEQSFFNPIHLADSNQTKFKNYNVCILILESFSKEYTGIGNRKSYTPFLDSLMTQSIVFKNGIANGKTSIEGIPSIVASLPSYMSNPFINSIYSNNSIQSLANTLKNKNYNSVFYHGGTNGTMNFNAFAAAAGFDRYFGRSEYNNDQDYDGHWGIWDEPFLQKVVNEMSHQKQPFFSTVFSLSSHNPYKVPEKYQGQFPKGKLEIHESIGYADYALKLFFASAQKQSWFKNTLFVLCPDHTGISDDYFYANPMGQYSIPILFYKQDLKPQIIHKTVQQIDIMPSILKYLNYDQPFYALGNNMFDSIKKPALFYLNPEYCCVDDSLLFTMSNYSFATKCNFRLDSSIAQKLQITKQDLQIEKYCKALIQRYQHDLIYNRQLHN